MIWNFYKYDIKTMTVNHFKQTLKYVQHLSTSGIILAPDFCERKIPKWTNSVRDFQIQWDFL